MEETNKGLKIALGIIINADVRARLVSFEINASIKKILKKNSIKLDKLNIFLRGIK